ncbi:hypothetical protein ACLQ2R_16550 [Streptosporangium sp. DT93]|uniref:hypothetical protein n=1 Tax=Streptosporangium sp. DT93 TaxID=3393428 RepID=UPI003CEC35A0
MCPDPGDVATFGTLYLGSGSVTTTALALAGTILVTGVCALPLLRRRDLRPTAP